MRHGNSAYKNGLCKCDVCRLDHRVQAKIARQRRKAQLQEDPSVVEHGRVSTYKNWGCRCDRCKAAASTDDKKRYANGGRG